MVLAIVVALLIVGTISCYYRSSIKIDQRIDEKKIWSAKYYRLGA